MTYEELQKIFKQCEKSDWLFNDERGTYTYKHDLDLRMLRKEIDFDSDRFQGEDWATKHPDPKAYREIYEIYYGSSFIKEKLLVTVDGFRATLPLPKVGTILVDSNDYKFATLVDQHDTLDEYMKRAGLKVQ